MNLAVKDSHIPSMTSKDVALAEKAEKALLELEQSKCVTRHTLHAGVYTRTILLKKGEALVGALIKIPTTLMINGVIRVYVGGEVYNVDGFKAFVADANRKQVMIALEDTIVTMIFKTEAKTIREAEDEFTDDGDKLMSRQPSAINITERRDECQER